jgi:hypothetical protein
LEKTENICENGEFIISSALGHIVKSFVLENFDQNLKGWTIDTLPILPEEFRTKPIATNRAQFTEVKTYGAKRYQHHECLRRGTGKGSHFCRESADQSFDRRIYPSILGQRDQWKRSPMIGQH